MELYIAIFLGLLILSWDKNQRIYFWPLILCSIAFAGLRADSVGTDTQMYALTYEMQATIPVNEHYEYLFRLLYEVLFCLNAPVWVAQICCSALTMVPLAIVIKKNKVQPVLALFFFYALFGYLYSFNAVRQMIGVSFALLAYTYYPQKLKALVCILIGMGFHSSAIIAGLVFLTPYVKIRSIYVIPLLICSFLIGLAVNDSVLIAILGRYSVYLTDPGLSGSFGFRDNLGYAAMMALLIDVIYVVVDNTSPRSIKDSKWFKLYLFMVILNNLSFKLVLGARIIVYFTMVQIILYPLVFKYNRQSKPFLLKSIIVLYVGVYFMKMIINTANSYCPYLFAI